MKRKIVTYEVPVEKDNKGICRYNEEAKSPLPDPEEIEITSMAEIQRLAVEISQENSRTKQVAEAVMMNNSSSTVAIKFLV